VTSRLRVALVGCGYFARFHRDGWARLDGAELVALCDRDPARLAAAGAEHPGAAPFTDVAAMLDAVRPDLLDIATPPETHLALVEAAAARGINMVCQKPLADDHGRAVEIVAAAERAGVTLAVHENFRFMPWFQEAKRLADAGTLGRVLAISFRLRPGDGQGPDAYLSRQPYFQKQPRFLIHETGIHLIDVFRTIAGEVTGVFARLKKMNPVIAGEDAGYVVFDFASGAQGLFDGNRHVDHPADDTRMTNGVLLVEGTGGTLRLDGYGRLFLKPHGGAEAEHRYPWEDRGYGGDCVYRQQAHLLAHFASGAPLVNSGRDYLRNIEIEEAIYRSDREARFITV
jgi:predicted dehydrogenase